LAIADLVILAKYCNKTVVFLTQLSFIKVKVYNSRTNEKTINGLEKFPVAIFLHSCAKTFNIWLYWSLFCCSDL